MKCVIIDDEPLAIDVVESYVQQVGGIEIVAKCTNPLEAIILLNKHQVDLVFLDIEMPNLTGIDLVKTIDNMPQFIFTTAYPEYALDGFNLNATDYLVKPIPFHRFLKAISRAKEKYELENKVVVSPQVTETAAPVAVNNFIFVKSEYENIKINIDTIIYLQGLKDYIKIYTSDTQKPILTLSSFKDILDKLPPSKFIRVHKSYVVSIEHIKAIQKSKILVADMRIPVGETYKDTVMKRLGV
ncbi:LytR/AlgR family response regulator transcription factor [Algibacter lectus]|uniref:LytTR family two component transcriptional regulator n=1 Tax=Algibacter lectus TaxID=221126 RepID=A0A4R8MCK0_9FLAO|nr:response regulator transcription factor [Algibacter lectus]MWW23997.1 response regulator [Algibacter lectus]TDY62012.1 LytTR family two component transcriptional regulator [Algibacter lectus]SFC81558.1 DNA-binding response regulator, LytR/AlgR family [Algibacter lectus]